MLEINPEIIKVLCKIRRNHETKPAMRDGIEFFLPKEFGITYAEMVELLDALPKAALEHFQQIIDKEENHNVFVLLQEAGWEEWCPSEGYCSFTHPIYPGVVIELRFAPLRARIG